MQQSIYIAHHFSDNFWNDKLKKKQHQYLILIAQFNQFLKIIRVLALFLNYNRTFISLHAPSYQICSQI